MWSRQTHNWGRNLLSTGAETYTYDQANRLIQVAGGDGPTTQMRYNGLGDRLEQSVGGVATQYSLDLGRGLTQVLADGAGTYVYGAERLAQAGAELEYFGADGLGSVRQLYDSAGQVVANRRYEPFGSLLGASGTGESIYGFAGEQLDASTSLIYLRARYLDTGVGRFTQVDPAGWEAKPYLYAGANPATYVDPSGLFPPGIPPFPAGGADGGVLA